MNKAQAQYEKIIWDVIDQLADGVTDQEIADGLGTTRNALQNRIKRFCRRRRVRGRTGLVRVYLQNPANIPRAQQSGVLVAERLRRVFARDQKNVLQPFAELLISDAGIDRSQLWYAQKLGCNKRTVSRRLNNLADALGCERKSWQVAVLYWAAVTHGGLERPANEES